MSDLEAEAAFEPLQEASRFEPFELALDPADLPALLRHPALRSGGVKRPAARGSKLSLIWHDTPDGALAADGMSLAQRIDSQGTVWVRERMVPDGRLTMPPGMVGGALERFDVPPPMEAPLLPVAAFEGTLRDLTHRDGALQVTLLQGELRAVAATRQVCRLTIGGPDALSVALAWSGAMRVSVAADTLAAEAFTLARRVRPPRPLGAPALHGGMTAGDGFAFVLAHLHGVMLHHAALVAGRSGPEPVHQMRVALRRLRSAGLLFRRAVACPALADVNGMLKRLGQVLGPPRDWDVFTLGTGRDVAETLPDDAAVRALLAGAERRRVAGYAALDAYLAGAEWRQLGVALTHLAITRPWRHFTPEDPEQAERHAELQQTDIRDFAAHALRKRRETLIAPGPDLSELDVPALHEIRLHGKRLRYAAEFFAGLFPGGATRRFLRRMAALQERLGTLNDASVAAGLMAELPGKTTAHHYAVGVVRGYVAARSGGSRRKIERTWQRFLKQEPFWV